MLWLFRQVSSVFVNSVFSRKQIFLSEVWFLVFISANLKSLLFH